ncbi:MAG TPA: PorV/PorQ family protein, partial [Bacteroidota bacterium]|nr:PorV/PorQ family protein [Bacteroidota bacterium]
LLLPASVHAQSGPAPNDIERAGQSGWQFLKINGDARQAAMGGAFTAISSGDASAVFGNPASLADVRGFDVQVNALKWVADIGHQSLAVAGSVGDFGVFALSVAMLNYGDIPETINQSNGADGTTPVVTGNTFTAGDIVAGLSYARKITDRLSVGGSFRLMRETIAELSMNNWSLDFGTMYYTGVKSLRVAVTARNFGPDSRFGGWSEQYQTQSEPVRMPLDIRAGIAMDFLDEDQSPHLLTVVVEGEHPNDGKEKFNLGVSYGFDKTFYLRGGYKFNYDVQKFTLGAGFTYPIGQCRGTLNYAYVDFGELTHVHMFSLGFAF